MHGHIAHKKNVAGLKAYVLSDIKQTFDRDFSFIIKHVPVGCGEKIVGMRGIHASIDARRQHGFLQHMPGVRVWACFFKGDDFSQNLPVNHILDITETVNVRRVAVTAWFRVKVIKVGIEIMPQIVSHTAPSVCTAKTAPPVCRKAPQAKPKSRPPARAPLFRRVGDIALQFFLIVKGGEKTFYLHFFQKSCHLR